ncbi:hypothetical protein HMPREF9714_02886 [Myroides odoratimimus CCUG 12901]|nr:hypothetical protein HMPREF9714_02886 [Myroides odoratimimus CCUG 12901]MDM1507457.1 hypothetical protein [Myroides odoratimimus]MDM1517869.1 hypothetical protein [Myroides odoratimimus]
MGRYTDRSRLWEIFQSFLLFLGIVIITYFSFGFFGPLVVLLFSKRVKFPKWANQSLFVFGVQYLLFIVCLFWLIRSKNEDFIYVLIFICVYLYLIFMSFHLREYLERLDLANYMKLENNVSYSYREIKDYFMSLNELEDDERVRFIKMITLYKGQIKNSAMVKDLEELVRLVDYIIEKDRERSDLFFLKHSSSLESILKQYVEIQNIGFTDPEMDRLANKLANVISLSRKAFENELINMFDNEVLSMTSEADFYKNYLQSKGLI